MVKRRQPQAIKPEVSQEQIEAFASGADKNGMLNPNAKRDYKAIRVPFNEFEYKKLEEFAKKTGRSKLNAIRWAILQAEK